MLHRAPAEEEEVQTKPLAASITPWYSVHQRKKKCRPSLSSSERLRRRRSADQASYPTGGSGEEEVQTKPLIQRAARRKKRCRPSLLSNGGPRGRRGPNEARSPDTRSGFEVSGALETVWMPVVAAAARLPGDVRAFMNRALALTSAVCIFTLAANLHK